jgi:hypothetical protein
MSVMRRTTPLALFAMLFLLSACASSDGFEQGSMATCQPGDPLEISAGVSQASMFADGRAVVSVEVANNSASDVTVKSVRVEPQSPDPQRYDVLGGSSSETKDVKEGESQTFEVPVTIRIRDQMNAPRAQGYTIAVDATISVLLTNGDSTRCRFRIPVQF